MIKNERQYRITKTQVEKFEVGLALLANSQPPDEEVHPRLLKAQQDAMRYQIKELRAQLAEYDALQAGTHSVLSLSSFDELPQALIKARIAAGLSQKELAERLGLKEQQIQQYESSDYASASVSRLGEVIAALGLVVAEEVLLPTKQLSFTTLMRRLKELGLEQSFIVRRLLNPPAAVRLQQGLSSSVEEQHLTLQLVAQLKRIFGLDPAALLNGGKLTLGLAANARFKLPALANQKRTQAYTFYAHYLALLTLDASSYLPPCPIPSDPLVVRTEVLAHYGDLSLASLLQYVWSLGIPVLPLKDSGAFHGACWREGGRNVIVLKQQTASESRWSFDLLHELCHASEEPDTSEFAVVEGEDGKDEAALDAEDAASEFAGRVLLGEKAEELALACSQAAGGKIERLTRVVPDVARKAGVDVGTLANYLAFRLTLDEKDWWGSATNLQPKSEPWFVARDIFLAHTSLGNLNEVDRGLLRRGLDEQEG